MQEHCTLRSLFEAAQAQGLAAAVARQEDTPQPAPAAAGRLPAVRLLIDTHPQRIKLRPRMALRYSGLCLLNQPGD
jgi:hypothetical protein